LLSRIAGTAPWPPAVRRVLNDTEWGRSLDRESGPQGSTTGYVVANALSSVRWRVVKEITAPASSRTHAKHQMGLRNLWWQL